MLDDRSYMRDPMYGHHRSYILALLITLVFFATTLVFGKLEVIGHTMLHAALIVFLIEGSADDVTLSNPSGAPAT